MGNKTKRDKWDRYKYGVIVKSIKSYNLTKMQGNNRKNVQKSYRLRES
jgi:hypothetical protein